MAVTATATGAVALIGAIKNRRASKAQAVRWARRIGLPKSDASNVATFVLRLQRRPASWRKKQTVKLRQRLVKVKARQRAWKRRPGARRVLQVTTLGIMRGPRRLASQRKRIEAKLRLLRGFREYRAERRERRKAQEVEVLSAEQMAALEQPGPSPVVPVWGWAVVALAAFGAVVYVRKVRREGGS